MAFIAPAGTPVTLRDIAHGLANASTTAHSSLAGSMRRITGLPCAWSVSSGRGAMTVILRAMRATIGDSTRNEVIIPAYNCYSVPAAIQRAGLRPRLCDVRPSSLGIDTDVLAGCDFSRVLAVLSANLYGLPNDLKAIESICTHHRVFLLDDAAQALGANLEGRAMGGFGDAGLYSFDKGKIISTMQGGAIVCRPSDLARQLESANNDLPRSPSAQSTANLAKLLVYSICLRPRLYGIVRRVPFSGLGETIYEPDYPLTQLSAFQAAIATRLLARLETLNAGRRRIADELTRALEGLPGIETVQLTKGAYAVFARFPFRVMDPATRVRVIQTLVRAGIGATASYPRSLEDVPEVSAMIPQTDRSCAGAREVASTIVTLPTHAYSPPDLASRVRHELLRCLT